MTALWDLLESDIVRTVMLGAAILGGLSGMLGAFAVLRRQSLLGDTLSHAALPGVCIGFLVAGSRDLGAILLGAFASGAVAALSVLAIGRLTRLKTDAALGVVLSVFFAVGVVLLTVAQGRGGAAQAGLSTFLFGQAAAILRGDLWIMGGAALAALALVLALWKEFKLVSFDPQAAAAQGLPVTVIEAAMTVMVAIAIVVGLQLVGVILMVALLIAPAAAARQWTGSLGAMVALSAAFGAVAGVTGALVSATARGLSTGPVVVLVASAIVLASLLLAPRRGLIAQALRRRAMLRRQGDERLLLTVQALAHSHHDRDFPAEQGMLDAWHRSPTGAALRRLQAQGLVDPARHPPETTPHWRLTGAGHAEADRLRKRDP
ncbi:MAG: metal ABC transporter permease [Rhodobacteraceae bacterium]|nr:metal ABC transporter permease [Paracoccaceae bacterium]